MLTMFLILNGESLPVQNERQSQAQIHRRVLNYEDGQQHPQQQDRLQAGLTNRATTTSVANYLLTRLQQTPVAIANQINKGNFVNLAQGIIGPPDVGGGSNSTQLIFPANGNKSDLPDRLRRLAKRVVQLANIDELNRPNPSSLSGANLFAQHHHNQQQQPHYIQDPNLDQLQQQQHQQLHYQHENQVQRNFFNSLSTVDILIVCLSISIILISIIGNCLVCSAIFTDRRLRKLGNAFIVSLAIADLFVSCLVMTFALCNDLMNYWIFGEWFCDIWISFDIMCCTASILNLCAISLDRFIHIKDCLFYNQWMTKKVAISSVIAIWFISALVSFVPINLGWHKPEHHFNALKLEEREIEPLTLRLALAREQTTRLAASASGSPLKSAIGAFNQEARPPLTTTPTSTTTNINLFDQDSITSQSGFKATLISASDEFGRKDPGANENNIGQYNVGNKANNIVNQNNNNNNNHYYFNSENAFKLNHSTGIQKLNAILQLKAPLLVTDPDELRLIQDVNKKHFSHWERNFDKRLRRRRRRKQEGDEDFVSTEAQATMIDQGSSAASATTTDAIGSAAASDVGSEFSPFEKLHSVDRVVEIGEQRRNYRQFNQVEFKPLDGSQIESSWPGKEKHSLKVERNRRQSLKLLPEVKEEKGKLVSSRDENDHALGGVKMVPHHQPFMMAEGEFDKFLTSINQTNDTVESKWPTDKSSRSEGDLDQNQPESSSSWVPFSTFATGKPNELPVCQLNLTPSYAIISSTISFYIPCIIMLGLYIKLFACARRHVKNIQAISKAPAPITTTTTLLGNQSRLNSRSDSNSNSTLQKHQQPAQMPTAGARGPVRQLKTWLKFGGNKFGSRRSSNSDRIMKQNATTEDNLAQLVDIKRIDRGDETNEDNNCNLLERETQRQITFQPNEGEAEPFLNCNRGVAAANNNEQQQQQSTSNCLSRQQQSSLTSQQTVKSISIIKQQKLNSISQQQSNNNRQLATHKAAITLGIIMGTFLFCWVPFFCLNIIKAFCSACIPGELFRAFTWLGYANSALNPIIYGIHNSEFRQAFNRLFFKHLNFKNSRYYMNRRYSYDLRHPGSIRAETATRRKLNRTSAGHLEHQQQYQQQQQRPGKTLKRENKRLDSQHSNNYRSSDTMT